MDATLPPDVAESIRRAEAEERRRLLARQPQSTTTGVSETTHHGRGPASVASLLAEKRRRDAARRDDLLSLLAADEGDALEIIGELSAIGMSEGEIQRCVDRFAAERECDQLEDEASRLERQVLDWNRLSDDLRRDLNETRKALSLARDRVRQADSEEESDAAIAEASHHASRMEQLDCRLAILAKRASAASRRARALEMRRVNILAEIERDEA